MVDCAESVMKNHCYWPLVSDLNNVLSHRPVALKFMADDTLLEMWFTFLAMFQGKKLNDDSVVFDWSLKFVCQQLNLLQYF